MDDIVLESDIPNTEEGIRILQRDHEVRCKNDTIQKEAAAAALQHKERTRQEQEMQDLRQTSSTHTPANSVAPSRSTQDTLNLSIDSLHNDHPNNNQQKENRWTFKPIRPQEQAHTSNNPTSPVINGTLLSQGNGKIIIIKQKDKTILNNLIELANLITKSPFGSKEFKDIRTNKKMGTITAELNNTNQTLIEKLLKITKLGHLLVECYLPKSDIYKYGVIAPICPEADLTTLKAMMRTNTPDTDIIKIDRLKKRLRKESEYNSQSEWTNSPSIKITFRCKEISDSVTIAHSFYRVRPYVSEPIQCYNCQRMGHTSYSCTGKTRCLVCAGEHTKDKCNNIRKQCTDCKGNHLANSTLSTMVHWPHMGIGRKC